MDIPKPSVYVMVSGIPNVQNTTDIALGFGFPIYTNNPDAMPGATKAPPHILANKNIVLHIARAGWGSAWLSLLTETPLIIPPYDPSDDPETYFNAICIEKLGIGLIYNSQTAQELLDQAKKLKPHIQAYKQKLKQQFGTLNGARFAAKRILEHWLKQAE